MDNQYYLHNNIFVSGDVRQHMSSHWCMDLYVGIDVCACVWVLVVDGLDR